MMNFLILILTLSFTFCSSCIHSNFEKFLEKNDCEKAATEIPGIENKVTLKSMPGSIGGSVAKYSIQSGGHIADGSIVVIHISGGIISTVAACTFAVPAMATLTPGSEKLLEVCLQSPERFRNGTMDPNKLDPGIAEKAKNLTDDWGNIDLTPLSADIRRIAQCYLDSKNPEKAKQQLNTVLENKEFVRRISVEERLKVKSLLKAIDLPK